MDLLSRYLQLPTRYLGVPSSRMTADRTKVSVYRIFDGDLRAVYSNLNLSSGSGSCAGCGKGPSCSDTWLISTTTDPAVVGRARDEVEH
jgi:hypothetical protein